MKLFEALNIVSRGPSAATDSMTVGLVSGFTPLHLETLLHAYLQLSFPHHQIRIVTEWCGDVSATVRELMSKQLDAVALALEWEDLDSRLGIRRLGGWGVRSPEDILEQSSMRLELLELLLKGLSDSVPIAISMPTLPLPPLFFPSGSESGVSELELREKVASFANSLSKRQRIRIVNEQKLNFMSPMSERLDVKSAWMTGFPYRISYAASLADLLARLIQNRPPKKGLITDLDNTLWNGIVGEIGVKEITWDLDHHSQGHGLYQQMLQTLSEEGVLIGAVSKNDPTVVEEALRRDDLIFSKDRISMLDVSWGSKAKAVTRILAAWNIGPDSITFIDDSPLELAEVKASHPDVECVCFPQGEPKAIYELLVHLRDLFGKRIISEEDRLRHASMRLSAAIRVSVQDSQGFSDTLLEQAEAELTLSFRKDPDDFRALELINKTNQFNLNGRRFTEVAWSRYLQQENSFQLTASYKDRFGVLGKIAVLAGHIEECGVMVDICVLSCRAFALRIEHQCVKALFRKLRIDRISFAYLKTPRNGPIARFFSDLDGQESDSKVTISLDQFQRACPKLFHQIVEIE